MLYDVGKFKKRINTSILLVIIIFLIFSFKPILVLTLLIVGNLTIIEFSSIIKKIQKKNFLKFVFNLLFITYIFIFFTFIFIFSNFLHLKLIFYSFLLCCVASDIGGYIFGNIFKGPKLTSISPKKTISGSIGSVLFCVLIFAAFLKFYSIDYTINFLFLSLIITIACQLGDIFFHFLKEKQRLKIAETFYLVMEVFRPYRRNSFWYSNRFY